MEREIKIFKYFQKQEDYQIKKNNKTTAYKRFANLRYMQNFSRRLRPEKVSQKKIIITHGFTTP